MKKLLTNLKKKKIQLHFSLNYKIVLGVLFIWIVIVLLSMQSLLAQGADYILRPILGEKNTLLLESYYFSLLDIKNKFTYQVNPSLSAKDVFYTTDITAKLSAPAFPLDPIPVSRTLDSLMGEGIWEVIPTNMFPNENVMAKTFIRPDSQRPYAVVSLVKINLHKLSLGIEAGTYYPGGDYKKYGPGIVPPTIQKANTLLAVFNGGFQAKDGHYGMIVGDKTYVPLRKDLPALVIYKDGSASISAYPDIYKRSDVLAVRQNGPFLIKDGEIASFEDKSTDTWGRTTTNSMYTWRSGIGITKEGNLIYAVGSSLVPQTLAKALLSAGAVDAIQLDINPFWVRFILYTPQGNGKYVYTPLLKDMQDGGYNYLHGYNKDFFYVYKK